MSRLSPDSTGSPSPAHAQQESQLYPHACTTCVQRKVKCDKRHPCLACSKSHLQCSYRSTPPPQRRKRKIVEITRAAANRAIVDKLRDHEAVLRSAGIAFEPFEELPATTQEGDNKNATTTTLSNSNINGDVNDDEYSGPVDDSDSHTTNRALNSLEVRPAVDDQTDPPDTGAQTPLFPRQRGILISEYGGKRYYEHALIGLLGQQYKQGPPVGWHQPPRPQEDTELPALLAGMPETQTSPAQDVRLGFQHPSHAAMLQYWSIFKQNVHPVTMILHAPTTVSEVINNSADDVCSVASSSPSAWITTAKDALKFAICASAVASLKDEQCRQMFGTESKSALLKSTQAATRQALAECSFLRLPNIDLLRAFVLLLTSMLHTTDSPSLWVMLGTAVRLAHAQGLHRDGPALGLSPFDTEMRRRLWWYIVSIDARITEVMGAESSLPLSTNTLLPSNVNDSDLTPAMTVLPKCGAGASDMMLCLVEYETVRFLQRRDPRIGREGGGGNAEVGRTKKDITTVSDLERHLEDNFLRFCDPVIPLHLLATAVARSLICKLRQMGHRGQSSQVSESFDKSRKSFYKKILTSAARTISYDNLIHENPSLSGFLWHIHFWFPWGSPIFVLKIMASFRSTEEWDDDVRIAWQDIERMHAHHPEFSSFEADRPEYLVVGDLTLKAWSTKEALCSASTSNSAGTIDPVQGQLQQVQHQPMPQLIANLQARHRLGGYTSLYPWQNPLHSVTVSDSAPLPGSISQPPSLTSSNTASTFTNNTTSISVGGFGATGTNFNMITSPFVGVDWSDWDETRMY